MNDCSHPDNEFRDVLTPIRRLAERRKALLALPPERILEAILDDPEALPLVHSFPEEDFHFLIHDIGVEDCSELLAMASARQWTYLLDVETWNRDRPDLRELTRWFGRLMDAAPDRMTRWIGDEQLELFEYYLYRNVDVAVREHDQDPADLGEDFVTFDDVFYFRFRETVFDPEEGSQLQEDRDQFLNTALRRLSGEDLHHFQGILLESASLIPAEWEEEAYRLRNARLAEKGFPSFEEAVGIYQPLSPDRFAARARKHLFVPRGDEAPYPVPLYASRHLGADDRFGRALALVGDPVSREGLQAEFAGLCNRLITADGRLIRERETLREAVAKACGYLGLGLRSLTGPEENETARGADLALLLGHPLVDIFRVGYGEVLRLKWRAEKWRRNSWFERRGFSLSFWDEKWMGVLGGLLLKRPLFFDDYVGGVLYREFRDPADMSATGLVLDRIEAMDGLLADLDFPLAGDVSGRFVTWKKLLLTFWCRRELGLPDGFDAVPLADFRRLFDGIRDASRPDRITDGARESFLRWIAARSGRDMHDLSGRVGAILEDLFGEVEEEIGQVMGPDLDPRFVHLFLIA